VRLTLSAQRGELRRRRTVDSAVAGGHALPAAGGRALPVAGGRALPVAGGHALTQL
jgi:hypothetical protein